MENGGGRVARPCDVCARERARWFCAADDAYLCNRCDASVHSANAVARRHERKPIGAPKSNAGATTAFLFGAPGYRRRARSNRTRPQRKAKADKDAELATVAVPEHESAHSLGDEDDFLPQVPIFVPALAEELCEFRTRDLGEKFYQDNCEPVVVPESDLHQFLNSDTETDLFALDMEGMDVESIIGQGLGDDGLGLLGFHNVKVEEEARSRDFFSKEEAAAEADVVSKVKVEVNDCPEFETEGDQSWDTIEINLDYHAEEEDQDIKLANSEGEELKQRGFNIDLDLGSILGDSEKKVSLNLNYEDVLLAWSDRGSLWASYDDCTSDGGGGCGNSFEAGLVPDLGLNCAEVGNLPSMINGAGDQDSSRQRGREARVLRYREKRRTRLFSKKIRYEVRKLNAEKRPRMKGRFVKRTSGMASD